MKKAEKIYAQLQNTFSDKLGAAAKDFLGTEVTTEFDIFIFALEAYSRGYEDAMQQVGAHR